MHDVLLCIINGCSDWNGAAGNCQRAAIARLSASGRIADRTVEDDTAALIDTDHGRITEFKIGVVAKKKLCHGVRLDYRGGFCPPSALTVDDQCHEDARLFRPGAASALLTRI